MFKKKAPMHLRRKLMSSHLSPELKKKYKKKSIPIRKGDEVLIMRGSFKGSKGKVEEVKRKSYKVFVENIVYEKKNGTKVRIPINASNLMITSLNVNDAKRFGSGKQ